MEDNLFNIINDFGNSFAIQDWSILVSGMEYYFTRTYDKNIYKGEFKLIYENSKRRMVFENVTVYDGKKLQYFAKIITTDNVNKIYYF